MEVFVQLADVNFDGVQLEFIDGYYWRLMLLYDFWQIRDLVP